jgi:hypothetical protein
MKVKGVVVIIVIVTTVTVKPDTDAARRKMDQPLKYINVRRQDVRKNKQDNTLCIRVIMFRTN